MFLLAKLLNNKTKHMKITILSILLLLSISLTAQNKFTVNGYCSPNYSYTFTKSHDEIGDRILAHRDTSMSGGFGFHAGVSFDYHISDRFSIGLGFNYSKHQFKGLWIDVNVPDSLHPIAPPTFKNDDMFEFVHIPLQIKYHLNTADFRFYIHTGLSFQYLLSYLSYSTSKYEDGSVKTERYNWLANFDYDRFNMVLNGGIGIAYHFNDNLAIYTEPHFRYSLLRLIREKDNSLDENFYSFGLQTGISWSF